MDKAGTRGQEALLLTEALTRFIAVEMPARNLSQETRRGYAYDLTEWVATSSSSLPVSALSTDGIARYLSALDDRGLAARPGTARWPPIKTFLHYLEREGALPIDFSARLGWPEVARDEPRALSQPEYTALLREAGHHPRDTAILELLLQTGIRLAELTALTVADVTLPTKPSLDPVHGYGLLRVHRKGRRLQELILNYKACRALKAYLRTRPAAPTEALFLTKYQASSPSTTRR
jgi:site-specific recombinase XerD